MTPLVPWLYEWAKNRRGGKRGNRKIRGKKQEYLSGRPIPPHIASRTRERIVELDAELDRKYELPSFLNALKIIPANCGYDDWFKLGAAIHDYDPGPNGLLIFKYWSRTSSKHQDDADQAACERKWAEYDKKEGGEGLVTKATIYAAALEIERINALPRSNNGTVTDANGQVVTLPPQLASNPIVFPDLFANGRPKPTCVNARVAIRHMGLCCKYDTFHQQFNVAGQQLGQWAGDITDDIVHMLRIIILDRYQLDPGSQHAYDAAVEECLQHAYHPVLDYLDSLKWDGIPRINNWLHTYMSADESALTREMGKLILLAAVRRMRHPGCKFDQILVLEGPEGRGKSLALETLAGRDNFSDHEILTLDDRRQQEEVRGVWLYEISELTGIRKAEIDKVKAFASRTVDRARPAYGRKRIDQPRTCVFFGTTNESSYLMSMTGNRRFWPILTGKILLDLLARDRDQLWAEAAHHEKLGASIGLAESFWGLAAERQEERREVDPWEHILDLHPPKDYPTADGKNREFRLGSTEILETWLKFPPNNMTSAVYKRLTHVMRKLGWEGPVDMRLDDKTHIRGFHKPI